MTQQHTEQSTSERHAPRGRTPGRENEESKARVEGRALLIWGLMGRPPDRGGEAWERAVALELTSQAEEQIEAPLGEQGSPWIDGMKRGTRTRTQRSRGSARPRR